MKFVVILEVDGRSALFALQLLHLPAAFKERDSLARSHPTLASNVKVAVATKSDRRLIQKYHAFDAQYRKRVAE